MQRIAALLHEASTSRPDERETKIMTNNEKVCGTLRSVLAVDGKLKCNLEWPNSLCETL